MATKRVIPLNNIEGVVAGGTATIRLPRDVRYHAVVIQYDTSTAGGPTEANMEAELTQIRVNIDNVTQRKASTAQIFDINRTKGKTPIVGSGKGYLPIFFSEPQRKSQIEQEANAWGMLGVDSFTIEVDIASGASSPELKGFAIVDDVQEAPVGIVKWKQETIQVASTGDVIHKLSTDKGDSYQGLFFFEDTAGDIDSLLITWDGVKVFQLTEDQRAGFLEISDFETVTKLFHVPLDHNHPADVLRSVKTMGGGAQLKVQELLTTLTMGAAANVTLIRELVGAPD